MIYNAINLTSLTAILTFAHLHLASIIHFIALRTSHPSVYVRVVRTNATHAHKHLDARTDVEDTDFHSPCNLQLPPHRERK